MTATSSSVRPYREFGSWLRSRRLARRWTQEELARQLNYGVTYVRKIEWGERRASEPLRVRLAQVFAVPLSSLPLSVASTPPGRVPETPSPLVGRDDELRAVTGWFEDGIRLVSLVGPAGIGKTRLATEVAFHFDTTLAGGACFVALSDVSDPAAVTEAIARAIGVVLAPDDDDVGRLVECLKAQEVLLLLDNFEQVLEAAPMVSRLLAAASGLRVLVTSRQSLGVASESEYVVPPLALPRSTQDPPEVLATVASVALFLARAHNVNPDFSLNDGNAAVVADICTRLQGIPMAIELAAGIVRFLPPEALLGQASHGLALPDSSRDAGMHQRALRAAIGLSFQQLRPHEDRLMMSLAVFVGGCTADAARAVCRSSEETTMDVESRLLRLASKSLLQPLPDGEGGTRFVALDAVREFAAERLRASGELDRIRARHAAWAVQLVENTEARLTGADQAAALAQLESEHANLRAALSWSLTRDPSTVTLLCAGLWRFWWVRGHVTEGRRWLDAALSTPRRDSAAHAHAYATACVGAGVLARTQGAFGRAVELLTHGAACSRSIGDRQGLALAVINLGIVAEYRGDHDRACELFLASKSLYDGIGDRRGVGHCVNCLGTVRLGQGDLEASGVLFEKALSIFRQLGDDWSVAMALANLGWIAHKQGKPAVALPLYEKGLGMYRALGDDGAVANMLVNLGMARQGSVQGDDVTGLFKEALLSYVRLGERRGVAECLEALAAARSLSAPTNATVLFSAAETLRDRIGVPLWPDELERRDQMAAALRRDLGPAQFDECWRRGRMLSDAEVVTAAVLTHDAPGPTRDSAGPHP